MKVLKCMVLILCFCLLNGCSSQNQSNYISGEIGIRIPKDVEISTDDTHSGFHGDGTTYTRIKFEGEVAENICTEIKENNNWNELPFYENLQLIMYGGTKNNVEYNYKLADEVGIPTVQNGYWIFIDRAGNQKTLKEDTKLFDRYSFNFTIAIYDTDNNVLYYYEIDT